MLCKKCGKNECYERNGHVFALCASCSWENLMGFMNLPDPRSPTLREADGDTCPDCKGKGIVVGIDDALFQCRRCKGSGHV